MGWFVVKFVKENAFEVVPQSWFVETSSECFWPPSTVKGERILKLIELRESPESDWQIHPARKLGSYGDLAEAKRKARKAVVCSDLSSGSDVMSVIKNIKRKRRQNPKYIQNSSSECVEESEDEDTTIYPKFKKGFSQTFLPMGESSTKVMEKNNFSKRPLCGSPPSVSPKKTQSMLHKMSKSDPTSRGVLNSGLSQTLSGMEESTSITKKKNFSNGSPSPHSGSPESTPSTSLHKMSKASTSRRLLNSEPHSNRPKPYVQLKQGRENLHDDDFKKTVLNELCHLHLKINGIAENINTIASRLVNNSGTPHHSTSDEMRFIRKMFPLKSKDEIEAFEKWLGESDNYNIMVSELRGIGGQSMAQTTRKILYRTMSNTVASLFSWDGAKQKAPLKRLMLARGILEAIKSQYPEVKETEIIDVIRIWMVKAKERMKNQAAAIQNDKENDKEGEQ